jgi:alanyl-tRNA synthetase
MSKIINNNSATSGMTSQELRQIFLNYFAAKKHQLVASSSLVPATDPSLLFTNAGMVQFKDVFLGQENLPYKKAASIQRCLRSGGKHNDLENVGHTARHHTFFEMLGNFSFGAYFKEAAIEYAWDFLTSQLKLAPERLWITVHQDDQETADLWLKKIKIDPARLSRCDADNFWSMGDTGPCGPCTEIFYDHGPQFLGEPPGNNNDSGERYIEIWNLVFMQYNRTADGSLTPLPHPAVDTGMGLERLAAVLQHVHNNYDTDLFQPLILATLDLVPTAAPLIVNDLRLAPLRIIADHLRATAFLIMDGVIPSNEGRGYVLRRIMRRALRQGHKLGINDTFLAKLVSPLVKLMADSYPTLPKASANISKTIHQEEEQFLLTLKHGVQLFELSVANLTTPVIPGELLFKLYDTYGFPVDLTTDMARERKLTIDIAGFNAAMAAQRERSRQHQKFASQYLAVADTLPATTFIGYHQLTTDATEAASILALYRDDQRTTTLHAGEQGAIILDCTPFYAEAGGQVGDQGLISKDANTIFTVTNTIKRGTNYLHLGTLNCGTLTIGDQITPVVAAARRNAITLNHTATHLLHAVLAKVLGAHASQQGSLITPERLRFDFIHHSPLSHTELLLIEQQVNDLIRANHQAEITNTTLAEAKAQGAIGLFAEKYSATVQVVNFGPSRELCGGTHARATGDLGLFKITAENGIAAGIRRIEAVTGAAALNWIDQQTSEQQQQLMQAQERLRALEKNHNKLKSKVATLLCQQLITEASTIGHLKVIARTIDDLDAEALRNIVMQLKQQLDNAIIVLATIIANKIIIVTGVSKSCLNKFSALSITKQLSGELGGQGGGKADFATGGATVTNTNRNNLSKLMATLATLVAEHE